MTYSEVIPMSSARVEAGHYVALGTSRQIDVVRREGHWLLIVDGNEGDALLFETKRQALQYCQEHSEL